MSFDWPWPPTYGGVIDVYYRIDALLARGVAVRLHVVAHDDRSADLPAYWRSSGVEVFYHRRRGAWSALSRKPYITASRQVGSLLPNLANGAPVILFEGVHCAGWLGHPRLGALAQWVRVHNVEADYYAQLAAAPTTRARRLYYREEARRLRGYEARVLAQADLLLPASQQDESWCERVNPGNVFGHRSYVSTGEVDLARGRGDYALFHGALHVDDNEAAAKAIALATAGLPAPFRLVIAGRSPSAALETFVAAQAHVELVADPPVAQMRDLLRDAQVIVLKAHHSAGYKIKLIESLALGRHVVANEAMYRGAPGLCGAGGSAGAHTAGVDEPERAAGVIPAETDEDYRSAIAAAWEREVSPAQAHARAALLRPYLRAGLADAFVEKLREETFRRN